jgi:hypothetical protein
MDSSDNDGLFANSEDEDVDKEQRDRDNANDPPPSYIDSEQFKEF